MSKRIKKNLPRNEAGDDRTLNTPAKKKRIVKKRGAVAGGRKITEVKRERALSRHAWGVEQRRYDKELKGITDWNPENVLLYGAYRGKKLSEVPLDYLAIIIRFGAKDGILRKGALVEFISRGYTEEEILEDMMRFNKQVFKKKEKNWEGIRFFKSKEQRELEKSQSGGVRDLEAGEAESPVNDGE